jgi:hypothetical protein
MVIISTLDYDKVLQTISNGMADLLKIESSAIYILEMNRKSGLEPLHHPWIQIA